jgi:hypothetical protein
MLGKLPFWKDYYKKYKNNPEQCRTECYEHGYSKGRELMAQRNLKPGGLDAMLRVINAYMEDVGVESIATIEGDRIVYIKDRSFCEIMTSALSFSQPWPWACENVAHPFMEGVASAANPKAKSTMEMARAKGDSLCRHYWVIEE